MSICKLCREDKSEVWIRVYLHSNIGPMTSKPHFFLINIMDQTLYKTIDGKWLQYINNTFIAIVDRWNLILVKRREGKEREDYGKENLFFQD